MLDTVSASRKVSTGPDQAQPEIFTCEPSGRGRIVCATPARSGEKLFLSRLLLLDAGLGHRHACSFWRYTERCRPMWEGFEAMESMNQDLDAVREDAEHPRHVEPGLSRGDGGSLTPSKREPPAYRDRVEQASWESFPASDAP